MTYVPLNCVSTYWFLAIYERKNCLFYLFSIEFFQISAAEILNYLQIHKKIKKTQPKKCF